MYYVVQNNDYLMHHGILGQRWGIRRYQNEDGSLTPAGVKRYQTNKKFRKRIDAEIAAKEAKRKLDMTNMSDQDLMNAVNRMRLEDQYTQLMQTRLPQIPPSKFDGVKKYAISALKSTGHIVVTNLSQNIGKNVAKTISDAIFGNGEKVNPNKQYEDMLVREKAKQMQIETRQKAAQEEDANRLAKEKARQAEIDTRNMIAREKEYKKAVKEAKKAKKATTKHDARRQERRDAARERRAERQEINRIKKQAHSWEKTVKPNYNRFTSDINNWANSSASVEAKDFVTSFYQTPINTTWFDRH